MHKGSESDLKESNELAIVATVAAKLSRLTRVEDVYELAIQALIDFLPIDRASILLFDESGVMRFVASRNLSNEYRQAVDGHSPWKIETTDAEPIVVADARNDSSLEPFRDAILAEGIHALAFIPLLSTSGLIGKFMLYVDHPTQFSATEISLASAIATQVALAVERARTEAAKSSILEDLRKERNTLRFLMKASDLLTSTLDADSILNTIALLAVPTIADWCAVDLVEEDGSLRRVAVAHKDLAKVRWAREIQERYPPSSDPSQSAVARVAMAGVPELFPTITEEMVAETAVDEEHLEVIRKLGMRSAMVVPLTARGHRIGAITLVSCESDERFDQSDLDLAMDLAQRAALAVDNSRLFEQERKARSGAERNAERIARLQEVTAALSEATTTGRVADVIIEQGIRSFGAESGAVAIRRENHAELIRSIGFDPGYIEQFRSIPLDQPGRLLPMTNAIVNGEMSLISSTEELVRQFPALKGRMTGAHHAFAAVPLTLEGRSFGAIGLSFFEAREFSVEDREFLLALARHCAQALDRARLYESEREARREAEEANRAKDDFLATLSHEMRTPLTAALGWARMLDRDDLDTDTRHQAAAAVYRSTQSQVRIVEDLLDVSRIIAGKMTIRREPVDLAEIVAGAVDVLRSTAEERGVRIETDLHPLSVIGDGERLRQVFWNLLSNAVKFNGRRGKVSITMRRNGAMAEVDVRDTGRGIEKEFIPHLFERFRQADSSTTRSFGGLGLGLSIVHHLVQLHGGEVEALSEGLDKGSLFTVRLPLADSDQN